jgi:hypothetical protein
LSKSRENEILGSSSAKELQPGWTQEGIDYSAERAIAQGKAYMTASINNARNATGISLSERSRVPGVIERI